MATKHQIIQTGISGLDRILFGGIPQGNLILIEGGPGAGKTLMGVEFIYRGATSFNEPGIIVVFETSPEKLIRQASGFGWDLDELQQQNKLKIISTSPEIFDQELRSPDSLLLQTAGELGARRIFIDGIGLLRAANGHKNGHTLETSGDQPDASPLNGGTANVSYRELLRQLMESLERENLTAMLSHEVGTFTGMVQTLEVSEFFADTVILLKRGQRERGIFRTIEVMKSRSQDFDSGQHTLRITDGKGLEVFRRVQSRVRDETTQPTSMTQRSVSGVEPIDALIGGGLYEGSVTMVVGVSGVGKTILSTQMLVEGARKLDKRGLMVTLDEHPAQIQRNAKVLGLGLDEQVEAGMIQILFDSPLELEIDTHFDLIIRTIEQNKIDRLVVDGLTTYSNAISDQRVFREFLHGLIAFTKNRLMTTFLNYENPELFGVSRLMAESGVSSIVDNIILLSFVELGNQVHRGVTVAKARGSDHKFITHEYTIGHGGIILSPPGEQAMPELPFQSYHGLLSRAPTRIPYGEKRGDDTGDIEKP